MMTRIRRAILDDVTGIAEVIRSVWEQELLIYVCQAQIQDAACSLWVAEENGEAAGFASAFLTTGPRGVRRWEIDLVAVRPDSQGRGLGQRLIAAVFGDAARHDVAWARALIRVDNVASKRAFEKVGFVTDDEVQRLLLWPPERANMEERATTRDCPYVVVDTLTYRGLWIEGLEDMTPDEQRAVVVGARSIVAREERLNTGAVVPADKEHLLAPDLRDEAQVQGEYYWFVKPTLAGMYDVGEMDSSSDSGHPKT